MENLKLYRKRYIPDEKVLLKDDIILHVDKEKIVTKWLTLKPRKDIAHGYSCYFLKEGFKVSKIFDENNICVYTYCDIIETELLENENTYIFYDLLIDVIIYPNNFVKVVDLGEIAEALDNSLITLDQAKSAMKKTDKLLDLIYKNDFLYYTDCLDKYIK